MSLLSKVVSLTIPVKSRFPVKLASQFLQSKFSLQSLSESLNVRPRSLTKSEKGSPKSGMSDQISIVLK